MSEREGTNLEHTPTWVVAIVCSVIVVISLAVERFFHLLGKCLKRKQRKPLFEALQKVKQELMLLGFISLLLTVLQSTISTICVPRDVVRTMLPCKSNETQGEASQEFNGTRLHFQRARRLVTEASSSQAEYCATRHKVPLLSLEALHHLHIFIFILAIVHVIFCVLTILFGGAKIRRWRQWEDAVAKENFDPDPVLKKKVAHVHQHDFIKELGIGKNSAMCRWLKSFFNQFYGSVTKSDYIALRLGFIMAHCKEKPNFNFHKYMMCALEDDFRKVVGISWHLWIFVVIFLLLNINGWHTYFWASFLPFSLLLALGTKLEHVIAQLAHEIAMKHVAIEEELVVKPSDRLFWFNRPRIVLFLIHFILFQNSFEISFFFWILVQYGFDSCIMGQIGYIIPRLVIGLFIQIFCSYSTLPLYAIVTQMGSTYKKAIFDEQIRVTGWAHNARRLEAAAGPDPNPGPGTDQASQEIQPSLGTNQASQEIQLASQEIQPSLGSSSGQGNFANDGLQGLQDKGAFRKKTQYFSMADHRNGNAQPPNGASTGAGNAYAINLESFSARLKALYLHWNEHKSDLWGSSDVLTIATPPASEDRQYLKSSALNIWLLGYEFPETIMVFTEKQIHFLCSQKKASLLEVVKRSAKEAVGVDVVMHVKAKSDDGSALMDAIFSAIRGLDSPVVGHIAREAPEGKLLETWTEKLKDASFQLSDVTNGLSDLFAVKDSGEIINMKKAAFLGASVMNNVVVPKLENVIDEEKKVTHSSLMDEAEKAILEPSKAKVKLKAENVDICYPPIFQSGGEFDLRPSAASNDELLTKTILRSDNQEISKEELRRQHQAELARQKNEETARRLAGGGNGTGDHCSASKTTSNLVAYKSVNDLPPAKSLMIQIDKKNEAVLLPIYGSMVPFHVATIRTVSSQQDTNRNCYIRIIFNVPGTNPQDTLSLKYQGAIFLKEASFCSKDPRHSGEVVQGIKTLQRHVVARESERAERATLVNQEKLQLAGNRFKPTRLTDLWIRPVFGGRGRKLPGTLEAHVNGFRFSTTRSEECVDIMFANIKHAFFQPAEKEMITLLHFHLHNHIMVGNKKTKDVQYYVEVMDVVQTLGGGKRSAYDPDEMEEEQQERDRKNKINMDFHSFVNRVNDLWGQAQFKDLDLEFDQPLRELGFHGVHHKASAFIVPTSSCLVELVETPFLVVTLSEIEIVNLERVGLGQKNFDMTIVFKDLKRDVLRIDSIPSTSLDGIKEGLDTIDIKYYESRLNLNWRQILKTITDDPQSFINDGGWEFLNLEDSDTTLFPSC